VAHHGGHHPFSHGWYGRHAGAWGWGNGGYGWGNPWAAATLGTAATWLGLDALEGAGYPAADTTVYTGDSATTENQTADNDNADDDAADNAADQTADNAADDESSKLPASAAEANKLASSGAAEQASDAKFLPLGVYSIAPEGQDDATAVVHLAVSKEGVVRGTYYDLKTDKDSNIQGAVDKKTGRVAWSVVGDGKVVYETTLRSLTDDTGAISVHEADGNSQAWSMAHYTPNGAGQSTGGATKVEVKTGEPSSPGTQPARGEFEKQGQQAK
jgi:hypothetical protein